MSISERLSALRAEMKRNGVDMYYIPTDDYHGSEYVCGHFKCREYISGFTGSAGTVIVTDSYAGLWTDGRYFIQAEKQLRGSEYVLNKSGETGVLPPTEYILKNLGNGVLGFDGRTVSASFAEKII
ncbi:MAG: aminopeptidase P family N-terminal domain-containing protein, partial [Oscillospiraceae bacterium]